MLLIDILLVFLLLLVIHLLLRKHCLKPPKFPPGPPRVPMLGSIPFLKNEGEDQTSVCLFHISRQLVKQYGKVCGFYLGRQKVVIVSDFKVGG